MLAWTVRARRMIGSVGGRPLWPQQPKTYPTLSGPACAKTPIPQMFQNVSVCGRKLARLDAGQNGAEFQFERPDWTLFRSVSTLSQKAGVPQRLLRRLVLTGISQMAKFGADRKRRF